MESDSACVKGTVKLKVGRLYSIVRMQAYLLLEAGPRFEMRADMAMAWLRA